jgi:hypothetical protein
MPLSNAQRCAQDSLSIIFSFCQGISHAAAAAQTCRSWRAAATLRQSSCRANVTLNGAAFLQMLQSPLCCHLSRLVVADVIRGNDLLQLHARCPQLEGLTVHVDGPSLVPLTDSDARVAAFNARAWPSSLRSLGFAVNGDRADGEQAGFQCLINSLPSSASRLHSFTLSTLERLATLDLAPLLQLTQLTHLATSRSLSPHLLAVVKQLHTLRELSASSGNWNTDDLRLLCQEPHQLHHLQRINISEFTLDNKSMLLLLALPGLTELSPRVIEPCCVPLLPAFPKLRKLRFSPRRGTMEEDAVVALLTALCALPELTSVKLQHWRGNVGLLSALRFLLYGLGAALPQLRSLSLSHFGELPPLTDLHTCTQLRSLRLFLCDREDDQLPADDVLELLSSLPHLESFEVLRCDLLLTDEQLAQLTPPSKLAPSLRHFSRHRWA